MAERSDPDRIEYLSGQLRRVRNRLESVTYTPLSQAERLVERVYSAYPEVRSRAGWVEGRIKDIEKRMKDLIGQLDDQSMAVLEVSGDYRRMDQEMAEKAKLALKPLRFLPSVIKRGLIPTLALAATGAWKTAKPSEAAAEASRSKWRISDAVTFLGQAADMLLAARVSFVQDDPRAAELLDKLKSGAPEEKAEARQLLMETAAALQSLVKSEQAYDVYAKLGNVTYAEEQLQAAEGAREKLRELGISPSYYDEHADLRKLFDSDPLAACEYNPLMSDRSPMPENGELRELLSRSMMTGAVGDQARARMQEIKALQENMEIGMANVFARLREGDYTQVLIEVANVMENYARLDRYQVLPVQMEDILFTLPSGDVVKVGMPSKMVNDIMGDYETDFGVRYIRADGSKLDVDMTKMKELIELYKQQSGEWMDEVYAMWGHDEEVIGFLQYVIDQGYDPRTFVPTDNQELGEYYLDIRQAKIEVYEAKTKGSWLPNISLAMDFVPIVGTGKGIYEVWEGEDPLTGGKLTTTERVVAGVGTVASLLPGGKLVVKAGWKWGKKLFSGSDETVQTTDKVISATSDKAATITRVSRSGVSGGLEWFSNLRPSTVNGIDFRNIDFGDVNKIEAPKINTPQRQQQIQDLEGGLYSGGKLDDGIEGTGQGTKSAKTSIETLTRDEARQAAQNLLQNGEISLSNLESMIPPGVPNTFVKTNSITDGAKYEFSLADGQKVIIRWHSPDPVAASKYPGAVSGNRWTAQIKIGNKQLKTDGTWTKNQSLNEVHVPIEGK
ncbi:pre-toxin TG domain-containing protein [Paenibacillus soyae]|uniref:Pre-toxin TG domain-containing protein n=1 Tax=Paenibacillus soyae TaxID=2969249 RepID=A0A9X2MNM4_9BACL|nr:pre-toxin TG domain-containing protein [Paenibacillus soyae]MCR2803387.1 pre-toxin TG domain-containing protein [Paenibacillus soyae]